MGRQERSVDPEAGEIEKFAADLRRLRRQAGLPTYRELARHAHYGVTTMSQAAAGHRLPSLDVTLAYIRACGADPATEHAWTQRWEQLAPQMNAQQRNDRPTCQGFSAPAPLPWQIPPDVSFFTGRTGDLARLDALLSRGSAVPSAVVITAIDGTAGVGKTALAVHWAHLACEHFSDGILYADLHGYDPASPPARSQDVLDQFLRSLGAPVDRFSGQLDALVALYRSILAKRRVLVVLDNAVSSEQVRPLLPGSPSCFVVVTSRDRLRGLVAHDGAHRITLGLLSMGRAVALLRRLIGPARADHELAEVTELARLCAYLPLALRIAAERVISRSDSRISDLISQLADERSRLDILSSDTDPVAAVRTVFSWSYHSLPSGAACLFRRLALHAGHEISSAAAAALIDSTVVEAQVNLDTLVNAHLIEEIGSRRYRFHDLLRLYANECARRDDPEDARDDAIQRVCAWYLATAEAANTVLRPHRDHIKFEPARSTGPTLEFDSFTRAIEWYTLEQRNLVSTINQASACGFHAVVWQLALVLADYFDICKPWGDWIATYEAALTSARLLNNRYAEGWILHGLGGIERDLGHSRDAIEYLAEAVTIQHDIDDKVGKARSMSKLGAAYSDLGQFDKALKCLEQSLILHRELGLRRGEGWTLHDLGVTLGRLGRYKAALSYLEDSLVVQREVGDPRDEGWALDKLGWAHMQLGHVDEAISYIQDSLVLRQGCSDSYGEAISLSKLGDAFAVKRRHHEARQSWQRSLAIFESLSDPHAGEIRTRLESLSSATDE